MSQSRWEARGGKDGFVMLQTPARDGGDIVERSANMVIDADVAVAGFKALFDEQWQRLAPLGVETDIWSRALARLESIRELPGF